MAERKASKVILRQLKPVKISSVSYKVNIPSFFTLAEYSDVSILESPPVHAAYASWCFVCYKHETEKLSTRDTIFEFDVIMKRLNFTFLLQDIFYRISLLDAYDMTYLEKFGILYFSKDCESRTMITCNNERPSYDKSKNLTLLIDLMFYESKTDSENTQSKVAIYELSNKTVVTSSFYLEIPDYFTLLNDVTFSEIKSPSFIFADATWGIRFELDMNTDINYKNSCRVYMVRLNAKRSKQTIFSSVYLVHAYKTIGHEYSVLSYDECNRERCINPLFYGLGYFGFLNEMLRLNTLRLIISLIFLEPNIMDTNQVSLTENRNREQDLRTKELNEGIVTLGQDFRDVLLNGQDHNITFNVKDKQFRAHQDILRARCEVFRSMLTHDMLEKQSGVVDVPDCDPQAFQQFLFYIYTGKVEAIDENNMFGLYYAADKYDIQHLKEECCEFIKKSLSVKNVCEAVKLAVQHSDDELLNCATNYFIIHADDVLPTLEWQLFLKENPTIANELFIKTLKEVKLSKS